MANASRADFSALAGPMPSWRGSRRCPPGGRSRTGARRSRRSAPVDGRCFQERTDLGRVGREDRGSGRAFRLPGLGLGRGAALAGEEAADDSTITKAVASGRGRRDLMPDITVRDSRRAVSLLLGPGRRLLAGQGSATAKPKARKPKCTPRSSSSRLPGRDRSSPGSSDRRPGQDRRDRRAPVLDRPPGGQRRDPRHDGHRTGQRRKVGPRRVRPFHVRLKPGISSVVFSASPASSA